MQPNQNKQTNWNKLTKGVLWILSPAIVYGVIELLNIIFDSKESVVLTFLRIFLFILMLFLVFAGPVSGLILIFKKDPSSSPIQPKGQTSRLDYFLKLIVALSVFFWILLLVLGLWVGNSPASIALLPLAIIAPTFSAMGAIGLLILAIRNRNPNKTKRLSLRAVAAVVFVFIGVVFIYPWIKYIHYSSSGQEARDRQANYDRINNENLTKVTTITVEQATDILNNCKVIGFYYTNQASQDVPPENKFNPFLRVEESTTGIVLVSYIQGDRPIRMHIADRMIETMVPIARNAQKFCSDLQFWHDGNYEQKQADGTWR